MKIIVITLLIGPGWFLSGCGGERERTVETSDCREIVTIKPDSLETYYKKITCTYVRRASGKIVGGTCVHVDVSSGLFYSSGKCETAYIYSFTRGDPGYPKSDPYLGSKSMCYAYWEAADRSLELDKETATK